MKHLRTLSILTVALAFGCKSSSDAPEDKAKPPAEAASAPAAAAEAKAPEGKPAMAGPTGSLFVRQKVKSFDEWKKQFEAHAEGRSKMGVVWHSVSKDAADESWVITHFVGTNVDAMEGFASGPGFKKAMEASGVEGEPTVWVANDVSITSPKGKIEGATASMFVKHEVEDFDKWKAAFDGGAMGREKAGIVGTSVSRVKGADTTVVVHMTGKNLDGMKAYATSDRMKEAMKQSGAKGEPEIWVAADVDVKRY